jgi:hypothetical protein
MTGGAIEVEELVPYTRAIASEEAGLNVAPLVGNSPVFRLLVSKTGCTCFRNSSWVYPSRRSEGRSPLPIQSRLYRIWTAFRLGRRSLEIEIFLVNSGVLARRLAD